MIARRHLLRACMAAPFAVTRAGMAAGAAIAAPGPPVGASGADRLAFRIMRHDSVIGSHVVDFRPQDHGFDVAITLDIRVGIGPITLFHYHLDGIEQWRGGKVLHVEAQADDDGTKNAMRCDRGPEGLWVSGATVPRYLAPADALPASHWNMAELDGPWINLESGKLLRPVVTAEGIEPVRLADGKTVPAQHDVLSGDVKMELWYDAARRWAGLRFVADDNSVIHYERL